MKFTHTMVAASFVALSANAVEGDILSPFRIFSNGKLMNDWTFFRSLLMTMQRD